MATASTSLAASAAATSTAAAASAHIIANGGIAGGIAGGTGGPGRSGGPRVEGRGSGSSVPASTTPQDNSNSRIHYSGYNNGSSSQISDHTHPHTNNAYSPPSRDHHYSNSHPSQQQQQNQSFAESDARIKEKQQQGFSRHEYHHPHSRDPPYSHQLHPQQQQQQQQEQQQQLEHHNYSQYANAYCDPPSRQDRGGGGEGEDNNGSNNSSGNHVNGSSDSSNRPHHEGSDREYLQERADQGSNPAPPSMAYDHGNSTEQVNGQGHSSSNISNGSFNSPNGVLARNNSSSSNNSSSHGRVHSAPHSFPSLHSTSSSSSQSVNNNNYSNNNSNNNNNSSSSASVSHHPNALNRYPFSIPSISAKLDQPHHGDGSDALSTLWKKTTPIQEPYFQTRHTIASQHTLSTLGGILFSLDEVPTEFNQDMYIAMRNRIFELEAKSVNYSPFSHSRKRSFERNGLDDYPDRYAYGYDLDVEHHSKRPAHRYPPYGHPDQDPPPQAPHRQSSSHPSWYTPEVYSARPRYPPHHGRPSLDRERDRRHPGEGPYYDKDHGAGSRPSSRPGSPGPNLNNSGVPSMRSAHSPPPALEQSRQQPHSSQHPRQSGPPSQDQRQQQPQQQQHLNGERPSSSMPHNGPFPPNSHPHPPPHHQSNHHLSTHPSQHSQHPHPHGQPHHPLPGLPQHQQPQEYQQQQQHQPYHHSIQPNGPTGMGHSQPMGAATPEQRQSIHQQRHRAQQQAQSAHSRSYHLHKHMRLLDQQRVAQMAAQQQQQQQHAHQQHQQQKQQQGQSFKPIQRQYQPHQQMYPSYNQPIAIKPHPGPTQAQLQQQHQQQQQQQKQQAQAQAQNPTIRPNPFQQQQQRLTPQQQMMQRYHQQRQLQQKQQQLRQLQYLRNRPAATYPTQKTTTTTTSSGALTGSPGSHSPTPPRVFGPQVDRPIKKLTRPLECSNCMALDSLAWKPKVELQLVTPEVSNPSGESAAAAAGGEGTQDAKILCPACTQYLQTHGKPRPVPPFRTNFLKKIHTRFKRELQEVRFQGWQDAQVLEIEDRMIEREFQMVFNGLDESDASQIQSRSNSVAGSPAPMAAIASASTITENTNTGSATNKDNTASTPTSSGSKEVSTRGSPSKVPENIIIKIEDDDEQNVGSLTKSKPENVEVRTFQSEASVGELFGHRWRTEPVVGYTLVHFGGSDRTRMVPMNPTVPFLTVKFDRATESITFAFRVLVNGLCLLSSGGGPPALHMPEIADDDDSEEEEEVVVVPDNDKEDEYPSPSSSAPAGPGTTATIAAPTSAGSKGDAVLEATATATTTTTTNSATSDGDSTHASVTVMEVDAVPK